MPITEAQLRRARYFPELLFDGEVLDVPASSVAQPSPLDLRRLSGRYVRLDGVRADADPDVRLSLIVDRAKLPDIYTSALAGAGGDLSARATERISLDVLNTAYPAAKAGYRLSYGLWVWEPSLADRMLAGERIPEKEIALLAREEYAAAQAEGAIPLEIPYMLLREYHVLQSIPHALVIDSIPARPERITLFGGVPQRGEALVLRAVALDPRTATDALQVHVSRDDDADYLTFPAFSLPDAATTAEMFIPAVRELRVELSAASYLGGVAEPVMVLVQRISLTDALRLRWGLAAPSEAGGEVLAERLRVGAV